MRTHNASPGSFDRATALRDCAEARVAGLRRLYEADADRLFGIAVRITRRRDLAEDVLHDAFILIWRHAASFDPKKGSASAWLATIVRNCALNSIRADRRTQALDPTEYEAMPDSAKAPDEALEQVDDTARLKHCLKGLDAAKQKSILLAYVEGLTQTQIAEKLGAPHNTVKAWIRRGLLELRECLQ